MAQQPDLDSRPASRAARSAWAPAAAIARNLLYTSMFFAGLTGVAGLGLALAEIREQS